MHKLLIGLRLKKQFWKAGVFKMDDNSSPLVSILVATFNRRNQLKNCLDRILGQTFKDFELVVIDDCSTDGTNELISSYNDPRIRYIYNTENVGKNYGDRAHLKRFVYELSRGKYFVYVCDDDFWISSNLLSKQLECFKKNPNVVMVIGGQLSCFLNDESQTMPLIGDDNLNQYLDADFNSSSPELSFFQNIYPKEFMTSDEHLEFFSNRPIESNIIVGATLYDKELFARSGALQSLIGSKWQAGYELLMGPSCYGNTIYLDEPCILTEIRFRNASFRSTQKSHYLDSLLSIKIAFKKPLKDWKGTPRYQFLKKCKQTAIEQVSQSYMNNTLQIKKFRQLGMCSQENISKPVTFGVVIKHHILNGTGFSKECMKKMLKIMVPGWIWYHSTLIRTYYKNTAR